MSTKAKTIKPYDMRKECTDQIVESFDWDLIAKMMGCCDGSNSKEYIRKEKAIMQKRIHFIIESKMDELICQHWIIRAAGKEKERKVEVWFCPYKAEVRMPERTFPIIKSGVRAENEWDVLQKQLLRAVEKEDYELCRVIKTRMDQILEEE
jgi:hypothetical protein